MCGSFLKAELGGDVRDGYQKKKKKKKKKKKRTHRTWGEGVAQKCTCEDGLKTSVGLFTYFMEDPSI